MNGDHTIIVAGIEFSADEVEAVTIKRDGKVIEIYDDDRQRKIGGFAHYHQIEASTTDDDPKDDEEHEDEQTHDRVS